MRSTYPDYFEKQKTTDTLPYSTREAHFANYTNKLKLQNWRYRYSKVHVCLFLVNGSWNLCYELSW